MSIKYRDITLFRDLNEEDFSEVEPYIRSAKYRKKMTIFNEGDLSENLFILISGKVKITKTSIDGKEIILEVISPQDIFGGVAVIKGFPYPANAVAMEDAEVLRISRNDLLRILDRFPALMYCMAMDLGDRMKGAHETLKNIALERVESRISSLLLKLADRLGNKTEDGIVIDMRLTKQDIAEMVGTTVETSIRTMSKLRKRKVIREDGGKVVIIDLEGLSALGS